jgi:hypothetical protein
VLGAVLLAGFVLARHDPFTLGFYASYGAVGALLAIRRPGNPIGWLLVVAAFGFVGTTIPGGLDVGALRSGSGPWPEFLLVWTSAWSAYAAFASLVALTLLFPSGSLPAGRWRGPAIGLVGACVAAAVLAAAAPEIGFTPDGGATEVRVPNRLSPLAGIDALAGFPYDMLVVVTVGALGIGAGSMLVRYRRATGVGRLQLRWLVAATAFLVLAMSAGLVSILVLGEDIGVLAWIPAIVAYPAVPAAIYVAITRYRLYEIDRVISRTVGWVSVTIVLAGVFALAILALQTAMAPFTNRDTLAVAASTLLAAALFQPLRRRVQAVVDRRFNRARTDAQRSVDGFAIQVRENPDPGTVHRRLVGAAIEAVQPDGAAVWIRGGSGR